LSTLEPVAVDSGRLLVVERPQEHGHLLFALSKIRL
jgi:hypothetical protein